MLLLMMIVGIFRVCCIDTAVSFGTFFLKNIKNTILISLHLTIQDLALFCSINFFNPTTSSTSGIVYLSISILISIVVFLLLVWMLKLINIKDPKDKLYSYELLFAFRMDYDIFLTYELPNLPRRHKQINSYSNLAVL
jgi:hypothetical protein